MMKLHGFRRMNLVMQLKLSPNSISVIRTSLVHFNFLIFLIHFPILSDNSQEKQSFFIYKQFFFSIFYSPVSISSPSPSPSPSLSPSSSNSSFFSLSFFPISDSLSVSTLLSAFSTSVLLSNPSNSSSTSVPLSTFSVLSAAFSASSLLLYIISSPIKSAILPIATPI